MNFNYYRIEIPDRQHSAPAYAFCESVLNQYEEPVLIPKFRAALNWFFQKVSGSHIIIEAEINEYVCRLKLSPFSGFMDKKSAVMEELPEKRAEFCAVADCVLQHKNKQRFCTDIIFLWMRSGKNVDFFDMPVFHSGQAHARNLPEEIVTVSPENLDEHTIEKAGKVMIENSLLHPSEFFYEPVLFYRKNMNLTLCSDADHGCGAYVSLSSAGQYSRIALFSLLPEYDNPVNRIQFLESGNSDDRLILYNEAVVDGKIVCSEPGNSWFTVYESGLSGEIMKLTKNQPGIAEHVDLGYFSEVIRVFLSENADLKEKIRDVISAALRVQASGITVFYAGDTKKLEEYMKFLDFSDSLMESCPVRVYNWRAV